MPTFSLVKGFLDDADVNVGSTRTISMASTSFPPATSSVLLMYGDRAGSSLPDPTSISGFATSWAINTSRAAGTVSTAWVIVGTGPFTDDEDIVLDPGGAVSELGIAGCVVAVENTPSSPIGLISTGGATGTTGTATLSGSPVATSAIACFLIANAGTALNADAGWTELDESNSTTPVVNSVFVVNTTLDQTYATGWGSSTGYGWIIFEVLHQAAGLTSKPLIINQPAISIRSTW